MSLQARLNTAAKRQKLREALAETLDLDDVEDILRAIDGYVKAVVKEKITVALRKLTEGE